MNTKHKPSKTVLINEKLEPIIIEIGKIENNIIGKFILIVFRSFHLNFYMLFFLIYGLYLKSSLTISTSSKIFSKYLRSYSIKY